MLYNVSRLKLAGLKALCNEDITLLTAIAEILEKVQEEMQLTKH